MKARIQPLLAAFGFVFWGGFVAASPSSLPLAPIVIEVGEIDRGFDHIHVRTREISSDGSLKQTACLTFFFQNKREMEVDAMVEGGVLSNRLVHVMAGTNLAAECRILGRATFRKSEDETLYGLILIFDSFAGAERAASVMREDMDTYMRRRLNDKRSWDDRPSIPARLR